MPAKTDTKKLIADAKTVSEEIIKLMGVDATVEVSFDEKNEALLIDIPTEEEAGLLIGSRGNTLNSLQSVISMILRQRHGDWTRVLVNIADWRSKEQQRLEELALQTAERAISSGEPQTLYNLTPAQRRIVHMSLSKNSKVTTKSQGEDDERYLLILPKK